MLTLLIIVFTVAVGAVWFIIYMDIRPVEIKAPDFKHVDGSTDVTGDATANHEENRVKAEFKVVANLNGSGKGVAVSEFGHEFTNRFKETRRFRVKIDFTYRAQVQVEEGAGKSSALIQALLVPPNQVETVVEEVQAAVGYKNNPAEGGMAPSQYEFNIKLEPKESCKVLLRLTASCESKSEEEGAKGRGKAEVAAKLNKIKAFPE